MSKKIIHNWLKLAEYDLETAKSMLAEKKFIYVAFTCQQAIEKILKALYIQENDKTPPYTHNLIRLSGSLSISSNMSDDDNAFIESLNSYYIETRYTEEIDELMEILTSENTRNILEQSERLFIWLKTKLK